MTGTVPHVQPVELLIMVGTHALGEGVLLADAVLVEEGV
jgi:hypothetical protein